MAFNKFFMALICVFCSLSIFASHLQIVSGNYGIGNGQDGGTYLLESTDQGIHWTSPNKIFTKGSTDILATTCSLNVCLGVGGASRGIDIKVPVILRSIDLGKTWINTTNIDNRLNVPFSLLKKIKCNGKICIAIGSMRTQKKSLPFIVTSNDLGLTWERISSLPISYYAADITDLTMTQTDFVIVGHYQPTLGSKSSPLILTSSDGAHWSASIFQDSNQISNAIWQAVKCNNKNCTAVGEYIDDAGFHYPLIATSDDGAHHWIRTKTILPSSTPQTVSLTNLDCSPTLCIAIGSIHKKEKPPVSLLGSDPLNMLGSDPLYILASNDQGHTWKELIYNGEFKNINIDGLSCTSAACLIAGYATENNKMQPIVLRIAFENNAWQMTNTFKLINSTLTSAGFSSINCRGESCVLAGFISDEQNTNANTLIANSYDGGKNWHIIPQENFSHLPNVFMPALSGISNNLIG